MNLGKYKKNTWVLSNRHIAWRVGRGFFRSFVLRRNTLKTIELFPTFSCPLSCPMCSVEKYKGKGRSSLTLDDYRSLANQGAAMGAIAATVLGGEPLAYPHLPELISIFARKHFLVDIVSNGVLASPAKWKELKKAGLHLVFFSLDALNEQANDAIRGPGHYQGVFKNLEDARAAGLLTGLSCVLFHDNLDQGEQVIDYCHRHGHIAAAGQVAAVGGAEKTELLTPEEQERVRAMVKKYPRLVFDWALSYYLRPRCPGGKEKIGITSRGDVIGCSVNPISFGNVTEEPLGDIWNRMGRFSQFAKDTPLCLAAEDKYYIERFLAPAHQAESYPVHFMEHPMIDRDQEPGLFPKAD